jgi:hypothetical protein
MTKPILKEKLGIAPALGKQVVVKPFSTAIKAKVTAPGKIGPAKRPARSAHPGVVPLPKLQDPGSGDHPKMHTSKDN